MQFIEYIDENMSIESYDEVDKNTLIYLNNIKMLKSYVLSRCNEIFNSSQIEFLNEWLNAPIYSKNFVLYHHFYKEISETLESEGKIDRFPNLLKDATAIEPYNISLGDVISIFEEYKFLAAKEQVDYYLVYIIKIIYSLDLSIELLIAQNKVQKDDGVLDRYIGMLNGLVMPENFNFYSYQETEKRAFVRWGRLPKSNDESISTDVRNRVVEYIMYTPYTIKSDIIRNIQNKNLSLRFRKYYFLSLSDFNEMTQQGVRDTSDFYINPFAFLSKKEYVFDALKNQKKESEDKSQFILTNVLTIDYLLRKQYSRRSESNYVEYALKRVINGLFSEFAANNIQTQKSYENILFPQLHKSFIDNIKSGIISIGEKTINKRTFIPPYDTEFINMIEPSLYFGDKKNDTVYDYITQGNKYQYLEIANKIYKETNDDNLSKIISRINQKKAVVRKHERKYLAELADNLPEEMLEELFEEFIK